MIFRIRDVFQSRGDLHEMLLDPGNKSLLAQSKSQHIQIVDEAEDTEKATCFYF